MGLPVFFPYTIQESSDYHFGNDLVRLLDLYCGTVPVSVRSAQSPMSFRSELKTYLFQIASTP